MHALLFALALAGQGRVFQATTDPASIQALIDAQGPLGPMTIAVPSGSYTLPKPLAVPYDGITLRGAGRGLTTLAAAPGASWPVVAAGMRRGYAGLNLSGYPAANDLVDGSVLLNGSVMAPAMGVKLRKGLHLTIPWQAWTLPALAKPGATGTWSDVPAFTWEVAVDFGAGIGVSSGILGGIAAGGNPLPFVVYCQQGGYAFMVGTADGLQHKMIAQPAKQQVGVHRLAFMADTASGKMSAMIDGALAGTSPATFKAGMKFAGDKLGTPMKFGGAAATDGDQSDYATVDPSFAFTLLGARLSSRVRYSATVPPAGDRDAYRTADPATIAYLPLDDAPAYVVASRMVSTINGSNNRGCGFLVDASAGNPYAKVKDFALRDLTLKGGAYGYALMTSMSGDVDLSNVTIAGGAVGFGNLTLGSNYTYHLSGRNVFGGAAWPIRLHGAMLRGDGIVKVGQPYPFGYGAGCFTASDFRVRDFEVLGQVGPLVTDLIYADGSLSIDSLFVDSEAPGPGAWTSVVKCVMSKGNAASLCRLADVQIAQLGPATSPVVLDSSVPIADTSHASLIAGGRLVVENLNIMSGPKNPIRILDKRWAGVMPTTSALPSPGSAAPASTGSNP